MNHRIVELKVVQGSVLRFRDSRLSSAQGDRFGVFRIDELFNWGIDELMNWGIDGSEFDVRRHREERNEG